MAAGVGSLPRIMQTTKVRKERTALANAGKTACNSRSSHRKYLHAVFAGVPSRALKLRHDSAKPISALGQVDHVGRWTKGEKAFHFVICNGLATSFAGRDYES